MKRVLITGASGFIGSFLVQHLLGFEIKTLSLKNPDWIHQALECDVIIHCAGIAHASKSIPEETYHQVNCELTRQLFNKAIQEQIQQFIFLSTSLVFGEGHVGAIALNSPLQPVSAYAKSKLCAEKFVLESCKIKTLILRLPLVLGEYPKGNLKKLANLAKISPVFINISNRRSVLAVIDLISVIQEAINHEQVGIKLPKSYDISTSEIYMTFRPRAWMFPVPHNIINFARSRSQFFGKLFGDFYYEY